MSAFHTNLPSGSLSVRRLPFAKALVLASILGALLIVPAAASAWTLQAPPGAIPRAETRLEGTSCASSTICIAVGEDHYRGAGFAESWNGSEWKVLETSFAPAMKAISCPSASMCMAVGKEADWAGRFRWIEVGTHHWALSNQVPVTPTGGSELRLDSVSCVSETLCTAVGTYKAEGKWKTLAESWSGTTEKWSVQSTPDVLEGEANEAMLGVSCTSASSCTAVGTAAGKPVAEKWNGSTWARSTTVVPKGAVSTSLEGISCALSVCLAVGHENLGQHDLAYAEFWSFVEQAWIEEPLPQPSAEGNVDLRGVSCWQTTCALVGSYVPKLKPTHLPEEEKTLVYGATGYSNWTIAGSPNPTGDKFNSLTGVSCFNETECLAAGRSYATAIGGEGAPLAETQP
jgi:hypothetical protein